MAVTRLKRKDRKNKVVAKQQVARIKQMTNLETGSRSKEKASSQVVKNREVIAELEAELKK
ncbi:MAG TPA: spore protein [Anseongella sp.]